MADRKPWEEFSNTTSSDAAAEQKPWEAFGGETKPEPTDGPLARGWKKSKQSIAISRDLTTGDVDSAAQNIAEADRYARANPGLPEGRELMQAWYRGDGISGGVKEVAGEIKKDWDESSNWVGGLRATGRNLRAMGEGVIEQAPNMVAPVTGMLAGGFAGVKVGGALGSVVPGAGTVAGAAVGGVGGGWAGASAGNAAIEGGYMAQEALHKAGIDPQDTQAVRQFLLERGDSIMGDAAVKGGIIGAVDVATLRLGSLLLNGPGRAATSRALADMGVDATDKAAVKAAMETPQFAQRIAGDSAYQASRTGAQNVARNVGAAALDPAGEFAGEYLGQGVATGEWDAKNAALEALSSIGQSGAMFAGQKAYQYVTRPRPAQGEQTPPEAGTAPPAGPQGFSPTSERPIIDEAALGRAGIFPPAPAPIINDRALAPAAPSPSQQMGLDPAAGPMSAAAALAVDTGASATMQQAAQAVDPETGEILEAGARVPEQKQPADTPDQMRERLGFIEQQVRANGGWDRRTIEDRDRLQAELAKVEDTLPASVADRLDTASSSVEIQQVLLSTDSDVLISAALNRPDLLPKIQSGMSPPAWAMFSADIAAAQQMGSAQGDTLGDASAPAAKAKGVAKQVLAQGGSESDAGRSATDSLIEDMAQNPGTSISEQAPEAVGAAMSEIEQPAAAPTQQSEAAPAADIKAVIAKQIPDMADGELQQAIAHYGPAHKRTAKLQKELQKRGQGVQTTAAIAPGDSVQIADGLGSDVDGQPGRVVSVSGDTASVEVAGERYDGVPVSELNKQVSAAASEGWDGMTAEQRAALLTKPGGWSTAKGKLNVIGKKIAGQNWSKINPTTRATIERLMQGEQTANVPTAEQESNNPFPPQNSFHGLPAESDAPSYGGEVSKAPIKIDYRGDGNRPDVSKIAEPAVKNPVLLKGGADSAGADAKQISDLLGSQVFASKGLDAVGANELRVVRRLMSVAAKNLKVRKSVIESIPVDVMDVLTRQQLTPDVLLDNPSMLKDVISRAKPDNPVPLVVDPATSVFKSFAGLVAEKLLGSSNLMLSPGNINSASGASNNEVHGDSLQSPSNTEQKSITTTSKNVSPKQGAPSGTIAPEQDRRPMPSGLSFPSERIVTSVQSEFEALEVQASSIGTSDGYVNFGSQYPDGRYYIESAWKSIGFANGQ